MGIKVLIKIIKSGVHFLIVQKVSKEKIDTMIPKNASRRLSKLFCLDINRSTKDAYIPIAAVTMSKISYIFSISDVKHLRYEIENF